MGIFHTRGPELEFGDYRLTPQRANNLPGLNT
ncbi:hypothetical protein M2324_002697 [Rhodovulum sulfidophilum]|nr:hypothetical protein [Rhodovulum sulfidophilum]